MDMRVRSLTKALKFHDSELYCKRESHGINVYRRGTGWNVFFLGESKIFYSQSSPKFVCALTHNWTSAGKPVEWGIEPVIEHIKSIDCYGDFNVVKDLKKQFDRDNEQKEKDYKNKCESFAYEWRDEFKKAFSDVNTSNLEKIDKRRLRDGYSK